MSRINTYVNPFSSTGLPEDFEASYGAYLADRKSFEEDTDADWRAAKWEAESSGKSIYRLSADGWHTNWEAGHCAAAAVRKALNRGWGVGAEIVAVEVDADNKPIAA